MNHVANSGQRARSSALPFREFWPLPQSRGRHFKQQLEFYAVCDVNYHGFKVGDPHSDFEQEKGEPPEFQSLQCFRQLEGRVASLSLVYRVYCEIFPTFNTVTGNFSSDENIFFSSICSFTTLYTCKTISGWDFCSSHNTNESSFPL